MLVPCRGYQGNAPSLAPLIEAMPGFRAHKRKASENEAFVEVLRRAGGRHRDWMVTGLFYSALHHISALLHHRGCGDGDLKPHSERTRQLWKRLPTESQVFDDYRQLKDDSEGARYECASFSDTEVGELQGEEFARLKARVRELLP